MNHKMSLTLFLVIFLGLFLLSGCSEDDPASPSEGNSSITIDVSPDSLGVSWTLSGPNNYLSAGVDDMSLGNLSGGTYTIAWGDVAGWTKPNPHIQSMVLPAGGTIVFVGLYTEPPTPLGTIQIIVEPSGIYAPWVLNTNVEMVAEGSGNATLDSMVCGQYSIIWGDVSDRITPDDMTGTCSTISTLEFRGSYSLAYPPTTTPDILMSSFRYSYDEMNSPAYLSFLSPFYRTILLQSTFNDWENSDNPLTEMYFDVVSTATIHNNLFGDVDGLDEAGLPILRIDSVNISVMDKEGAWEPVDESEEYFGGRGAYYARYNMLVHFNKPDGSRFEVDQTIDFFVIQNPDDTWSLLGARGLDNLNQEGARATDNVSYDEILALYRF